MLTVTLGSTKCDAHAANSSFSYPELFYVFAILCWGLKPLNLSAPGLLTGIREVEKREG